MNAETWLVAGRYRLDQQIGTGAMGVVWRAHDERLDRTVALKELLMQPGLAEADAETARARAMREGRIAARLQHPPAICVYDVALDRGDQLPSAQGTGVARRGQRPLACGAEGGQDVKIHDCATQFADSLRPTANSSSASKATNPASRALRLTPRCAGSSAGWATSRCAARWPSGS